MKVERVALTWNPPDAKDPSKEAVLRLQLVGTLTADVSGSHSAEGSAGTAGARDVVKDPKVDPDAPIPPKGSERRARDPIKDKDDDGKPIATGSGEAGFGGSREVASRVVQVIEVPPLSPFGEMTFPLRLVKRTPYGPHVDVYDFKGPGSGPATELTIRSLITQRIDYE